ncbi:RNA polymerase sigma factor [Lysinibacillus sp. 54212]|uniref:RNA polymerase sigma factor n=1 Tax=Lysinibacillus sp. 54212 TaxID=3119829 RepID=UPI002FC96B1B
MKEKQSFEILIRTYAEELLRLAFIYVKNKQMAEDIVQDVLLKAFEKRDHFRGESNYNTIVSVRMAISLWRFSMQKTHLLWMLMATDAMKSYSMTRLERS